MTVINVKIPHEAPHDIVVGDGAITELPKRIDTLGLSRSVMLFSSPKVFQHHGERVVRSLQAGGYAVRHHLFDDREENKTVDTWHQLIGVVADTFPGEPPLIVNLGGGVVMDVGGYVAASYVRGTAYIQLPTTLLGMVDCGIGGKTGVNHVGKNRVGAFYQPRLVLADLSFLATLPPKEVRSGLAEAIKYGVIFDSDLFDTIERSYDRILKLELPSVAPVVEASFRHKVRIVEQDERDTKDIRAKLNFGHTVGHALESATEYTRYAHGEAVAIGMLCACEIAERVGRLKDANVTRRLEALCAKAGLPTRITPPIDLDRVMREMWQDKKVIGGKKKFILPNALGSVGVASDVPDDVVRSVVQGRIG